MPDLSGPGLVPVAGASGLALDVPGATLSIAGLADGEVLTLPDEPLVYVFVVTGALLRSSLAEPLAAGDAFEIIRQTTSPATVAPVGHRGGADPAARLDLPGLRPAARLRAPARRG